MACDRSPSVLIVEDNRQIVDLFGTWLSDEYEVRTAYDGEEAVAKLDADVDFVLLDRALPSMSGDEVLEVVRERYEDCTVVMITSLAPDLDIIDLECDRYLVKPITREELLNTLDRLRQLSTYDETIQEYYRLLQKRVTLERELANSELAASPEYAELCDRIDALECTLDELSTGFDGTDFATMLTL